MPSVSWSSSSGSRNPREVLIFARILWAAMLMGQLIFLGVVSLIISQPQPPTSNPPDPAVWRIVFIVSVAMLLVLIPIGYFVRAQVYKRAWRDDVVAPGGYLAGNLILWACCEGIGFFGLVNTLMSRSFWPALVPTAVALAVMAINYPHGKPMQPAVPFPSMQPPAR